MPRSVLVLLTLALVIGGHWVAETVSGVNLRLHYDIVSAMLYQLSLAAMGALALLFVTKFWPRQ